MIRIVAACQLLGVLDTLVEIDAALRGVWPVAGKLAAFSLPHLSKMMAVYGGDLMVRNFHR